MKTSTVIASPAEIHHFWFGQVDDWANVAQRRRHFWFRGGPEADQMVRERFTATIESAGAGALDHWAQDAGGMLALVLVLDQMPRNAFRKSPRAFAFDPKAQRLLSSALELGLDQSLSEVERSFLYLPFEHAEDLRLQQRCVQLFEAMLLSAPPALDATIRDSTEYAREHHEVIARFGRFPHRNTVLGRNSTPEELAYLAGGARRFGQ